MVWCTFRLPQAVRRFAACVCVAVFHAHAQGAQLGSSPPELLEIAVEITVNEFSEGAVGIALTELILVTNITCASLSLFRDGAFFINGIRNVFTSPNISCFNFLLSGDRAFFINGIRNVFTSPVGLTQDNWKYN